jgi:hypothetical protein
MPNLIKAIQLDPEMYGEALDIFFKINETYIISERNDWGLGDMSKKMVLRILKVEIEIRYVQPHLKTQRRYRQCITHKQVK